MRFVRLVDDVIVNVNGIAYIRRTGKLIEIGFMTGHVCEMQFEDEVKAREVFERIVEKVSRNEA